MTCASAVLKFFVFLCNFGAVAYTIRTLAQFIALLFLEDFLLPSFCVAILVTSILWELIKLFNFSAGLYAILHDSLRLTWLNTLMLPISFIVDTSFFFLPTDRWWAEYLDDVWNKMIQSKDVTTMQNIENALECCGRNGLKDYLNYTLDVSVLTYECRNRYPSCQNIYPIADPSYFWECDIALILHFILTVVFLIDLQNKKRRARC